MSRDDALVRVTQLAATRHGAFTRRAAAALGFDSRRVATAMRHGVLTEPLRGVLVHVAHPDSWSQRLAIATLAGGGHAVVSHRSAARVHAYDGFERDTDLEVSVAATHRLRLAPALGVSVHHVASLDRRDIVTVDGLPVTGRARTLCDLGNAADVLEVRRALTDFRRRRGNLRWLRDTAERLHRPGQRGTGVLLELLHSIPHEGRVSDSWFENLLRLCLQDPSLPDVVPQYELHDPSGVFVARIDVAFPEARLGLEAHSRRFHFGPEAEPLDEQRDLAVAAQGWELLYLGWHSTKAPAEVLSLVRRVVSARLRPAAERWPSGALAGLAAQV